MEKVEFKLNKAPSQGKWSLDGYRTGNSRSNNQPPSESRSVIEEAFHMTKGRRSSGLSFKLEGEEVDPRDRASSYEEEQRRKVASELFAGVASS